VVAIFAGVNGYLDEIPVNDVPRFQDELRENLKAESSILESLRESGELSDETEEKLRQELDRFKQGFNVQAEDALVTP
jgi:F-type H+/Na+-transporting ATPase subunit alpha